MTNFNYQNLATTLKAALRTKKLTYAELGEKIGMTESGVQKIFSGDDCSIVRLAEICAVLEVSLPELFSTSESMNVVHRKFTPEQESQFIDDMNSFYFFWELKQAWYDVEKVKARHGLSDVSIQKYLSKLDKIGVIELHPGNVVKPVKGGKDGEHWSDADSRLRQRFASEVQLKFVEFLVGKEKCELTARPLAVINMKRETALEMKRALQEIQREYLERAHRENPFARRDDLVTIGNLNAMTPFTYSDVISVPNL